jgi:hypothetical protein
MKMKIKNVKSPLSVQYNLFPRSPSSFITRFIPQEDMSVLSNTFYQLIILT